ncbi:MAG: metallophosphoesterase [Candidatus Caldarchaeum sp.]|nr:metallophosphoesterase [Candidatus Caldarchaeum sp.]
MKRRLLLGALAASTLPAVLFTDESHRLEKTIIEAGLGVKLVFLPDLHIHHRERRVDDVLRILEAEDPDIVVLGGDLVDEYTRDDHYVKEVITEIQANEKYFVMGNHEYWSGKDSMVRKILNQTGYREIRGALESPKIGKIYGFDWNDERRYPESSVEGLVVAHDPNAFDFVRGRCLMLAGHTHGGLVVGGVTIYSNSTYVRGYYRSGEKSLYVSRGLGHIIPLRPFSSLEFVIVL